MSSRGRGVLTLQRRFRELGRVRMGDQTRTSSGKMRPRALQTWRFTSYGPVGRDLLDQVAALYGGTVTPWETAPDDAQDGWQVTTEANSLEFLVPPTETPYSVSLELWTAAGCARRCDGRTALVYEGRGRGWRERNCLCDNPEDPERRDCSISMRFGIILPEITGLGTWLVQTHSFHGAEELQGALSVLAVRAARGLMTPAALRIEPRKIKRPATDPNTGEVKTEVSRFVVPVIDVRETVAALVSGEGESQRLAIPERAGRPQRLALEPGAPPPPEDGVPVVEGEVVHDPPDDPGGEPPPPPDDEVGAPGPPPPEGPGAGRPRSDADGPISPDERRYLIAYGEGLGLGTTEIKRAIRDVTGQSQTSMIRASQLARVRFRVREIAAEAGSSGEGAS